MRVCGGAGTTASLVSKYRPPVPILTLVVPTLQCKDGLSWSLKGRSVARTCLIQRGVLPVLAAPSPSGAYPRHLRLLSIDPEAISVNVLPLAPLEVEVGKSLHWNGDFAPMYQCLGCQILGWGGRVGAG